MKKLISLMLLTFVFGCGREAPVFQQVELENGNPGFVIDCKSNGEHECLEYAHKGGDWIFVCRDKFSAK